MHKVLIIGNDHHNAFGLVQSFGRRGVKPYVIICGERYLSYIAHSRYVNKLWRCNKDDDVIECMLKNFDDKKEKTIVVSSTDDISILLEKNYDILKDSFVLPICKQIGRLQYWMDKSNMADLATKIGISIPRTWFINDKRIPFDIEYPCITKASSSVIGSKDNLKICNNQNELYSFLQDKSHCESLVIQKYIDKAYEFQLLGCSLKDGDEVIIPGRTHIDRPNGIDNTFFLKFDICEPSLSDLIIKTKLFIKETGYNGLFSVEFLMGKDGIPYFTEMNFRNDGNAICVTEAGVNLPYIYYLFNSGLKINEEICDCKIKPVFLMPELEYFRFFIHGEISFSELKSNFKKATCYTTYFKRDKKPFLFFLIKTITVAIKNKIGKMFCKTRAS